MEGGHAFLDFYIKEVGGNLQVECRRTADLYLEMLLVAVACSSFILGGLYNLTLALSGSANRTFTSIMAVFLFLIGVSLLAHSLSLFRDSFRKIRFSAETGQLDLTGLSLLGQTASLRFAEFAGFRINCFAYRRLPWSSVAERYEILLIKQNGDVLTVFPCVSTREQAEEAMARLSRYSGIQSM